MKYCVLDIEGNGLAELTLNSKGIPSKEATRVLCAATKIGDQEPILWLEHQMKDLVEYAKANPGKISYGTSGIGTTHHLSGVLIEQMTGVQMVHVPYKSSPQSTTDLIGGRIDFVYSSIPSIGGAAADGQIRLLAVAGKDHISAYPQLPSMKDVGHPDVDVDLWFGVMAPAGTAAATVQALNEVFAKATNAPELTERFKQLGVEIATGSPTQFRFP